MSLPMQQGALGATVVLCLSALAAAAQAPASAPSDKPPVAAPAEPAPGPGPSPQRPRAAPPSEAPAGHEMLGLNVISSDGNRIGDVSAVNMDPDGRVTVLRVRTGGFLGFGARIVAIPAGRFARNGQDVLLTYTAEEVGRLPEVKDGR